MNDKNKVRVFTYGTLMRNRRNHYVMKDSEFEGKFTLKDFALYDLGSYPGIVPCMGSSVLGECFLVSRDELPVLDEFEDEGKEYSRETVKVWGQGGTLQAETYVYLLDTTGKKLVDVSSRPWVQFENDKK